VKGGRGQKPESSVMGRIAEVPDCHSLDEVVSISRRERKLISILAVEHAGREQPT
jgi:hypothetical protein